MQAEAAVEVEEEAVVEGPGLESSATPPTPAPTCPASWTTTAAPSPRPRQPSTAAARTARSSRMKPRLPPPRPRPPPRGTAAGRGGHCHQQEPRLPLCPPPRPRRKAPRQATTTTLSESTGGGVPRALKRCSARPGERRPPRTSAPC